MVNYIIWNGSPTLLSMGSFALRWYGILFILGFLLCRLVLLHIYKKEGKPTSDVESLFKYIFIAIIIGARLGYVILYQPELIWTRPHEALLPLEFQPSFHFSGLDTLSGHGAILGTLIALWIYSRKRKPGQNYLQILDRIVILLALSSVFIGLGNFFNAELIGNPTASKPGVVFTRPVSDGLVKIPCCIMRNPGGKNPLDFVNVKKEDGATAETTGHSPILLYLFFKPGATEQLVKEFLLGDVKTYLFDRTEFVYEPGTEPLHYTIFVEKDIYTARIRTIGIARHPVQVYESIGGLILFLFSFLLWRKYPANTPPGRIFGIFSIFYWSMMFVFGYLKESRGMSWNGPIVNVEQLVSLTLFLIGAAVLFYSYRKVPVEADQTGR